MVVCPFCFYLKTEKHRAGEFPCTVLAMSLWRAAAAKSKLSDFPLAPAGKNGYTDSAVRIYIRCMGATTTYVGMRELPLSYATVFFCFLRSVYHQYIPLSIPKIPKKESIIFLTGLSVPKTIDIFYISMYDKVKGDDVVPWSYNRLWKLLIDKKMKKVELRNAAGLNPKTLASMGKDETVSMDALESICDALNCRIEDIVEFVPGETKKNKKKQK